MDLKGPQEEKVLKEAEGTCTLGFIGGKARRSKTFGGGNRGSSSERVNSFDGTGIEASKKGSTADGCL